jgi:hypothetical protein
MPRPEIRAQWEGAAPGWARWEGTVATWMSLLRRPCPPWRGSALAPACSTSRAAREARRCRPPGQRIGWHEAFEQNADPTDSFSGCINASCDSCERARAEYRVRLQGARSPSGRPQQFRQVETFEEGEVLGQVANPSP